MSHHVRSPNRKEWSHPGLAVTTSYPVLAIIKCHCYRLLVARFIITPHLRSHAAWHHPSWSTEQITLILPWPCSTKAIVCQVASFNSISLLVLRGAGLRDLVIVSMIASLMHNPSMIGFGHSSFRCGPSTEPPGCPTVTLRTHAGTSPSQPLTHLSTKVSRGARPQLPAYHPVTTRQPPQSRPCPYKHDRT